MNWKILFALIALFISGFISGMDAAFKIDQHLKIMSEHPGVEK